MRMFLEETFILSKADLPSFMGEASFNLLRAQREQKTGKGKFTVSLFLTSDILVVGLLCSGTYTSVSLSSLPQAFNFRQGIIPSTVLVLRSSDPG
jgi:hypothetical protein